MEGKRHSHRSFVDKPKLVDLKEATFHVVQQDLEVLKKEFTEQKAAIGLCINQHMKTYELVIKMHEMLTNLTADLSRNNQMAMPNASTAPMYYFLHQEGEDGTRAQNFSLASQSSIEASSSQSINTLSSSCNQNQETGACNSSNIPDTAHNGYSQNQETLVKSPPQASSMLKDSKADSILPEHTNMDASMGGEVREDNAIAVVGNSRDTGEILENDADIPTFKHTIQRVKSQSKDKELSCPYCVRRFQHNHSVSLHIRSCRKKHEEGVSKLPTQQADNTCRTVVATKQVGNLSISDSKSLSLNKKAGKMIKCNFCERNFPTKHQVRSHERVHTGDRPFTCYICSVAFAHGGNMIKHIKSKHPSENPYTCRGCPAKFKTNEEVQVHRKQCIPSKRTLKRAPKTVNENGNGNYLNSFNPDLNQLQNMEVSNEETLTASEGEGNSLGDYRHMRSSEWEPNAEVISTASAPENNITTENSLLAIKYEPEEDIDFQMRALKVEQDPVTPEDNPISHVKIEPVCNGDGRSSFSNVYTPSTLDRLVPYGSYARPAVDNNVIHDVKQENDEPAASDGPMQNSGYQFFPSPSYPGSYPTFQQQYVRKMTYERRTYTTGPTPTVNEYSMTTVLKAPATNQFP